MPSFEVDVIYVQIRLDPAGRLELDAGQHGAKAEELDVIADLTPGGTVGGSATDVQFLAESGGRSARGRMDFTLANWRGKA